ncbi:metaxin-2 isoform X2 [Pelodiscus sinensis]|uniref:metaxin-2 isoform X2 n=1 Tax=Pelodiscus sinensis TaxID=13735 RepID=UPI000D72134C|nr:metaxin-2 isoform X3 [Pelodiscus sinensis]|eukprot:XP_025038595.1 metaxin-2 isoform X3 [Pelodiscus sinensis]
MHLLLLCRKYQWARISINSFQIWNVRFWPFHRQRPFCKCAICQSRWFVGQMQNICPHLGHSLSDGLDEVQKAEMKAYMELVNNMLLTAELYLQWCDDTTVEEITHPRYGSPYPWPLNRILTYQKQWEVRRKMKAIGWAGKSLEQVLEDVDQCCQALSQRLGTQPYFFNKQPTELDALVFGHLFTILTTQLTSDELSEKVKNYSNLVDFCRRIEQHYFEDHDKDSSASAASRSSKGYLPS